MSIDTIDWKEFEAYLKKARGQGKSSIQNHHSRFKFFCVWFSEKEFNSHTFSDFLEHVETDLKKSPSYQNNCIKLAKHLAAYLNIKEEFEDFKYINEGDSTPEYVCSRQQIQALAERYVKYERFKNRKEKHRALIYVLGEVGSRITETLLLEWRDIIGGEYPMIHFRAEITKTKRERFCPIPQWLFQILMELPKEGNIIFEKIDKTNFRNDLALRAKLCDIPYKVKPHTLRDSSINNKLRSGMQLEEAAAYHGHVNIATTYRYYVRIKAEQLAHTLRRVDPSFKPDQTYKSYIDMRREEVEKSHNPQVANYHTEEYINKEKKREFIVRYVER